MTKLCSVCGTENREEAQFCRACGTAFAAQRAPAAASAGGGSASNVCSECGFQNKPGLRYCANCGMSLAAPSSEAAAPIENDAAYPGSPPPISYPSFAPVAPYPPAPAEETPLPDLPDPAASIALRQQEAAETQPAATSPFDPSPRGNRTPLVVGIGAAVLIVAGVLAWTFMRNSDSSPPAVGATVTPKAAIPRATAQPSTPIIIEEAAPSSAAPATSSATATESVSPPASPIPPPTAQVAPPTSSGVLGAPPTAAAPLPQIADPAESPEAEAKRVAAQKRREKAERDKADREAKAKALAEQREQTTSAAQRAEQDAAAARRRADDAQRARPNVPAAAPPPAVAQPRGVREICAGRGAIAEAVCQARQCLAAEHANEPICRQTRENDERRRNML